VDSRCTPWSSWKRQGANAYSAPPTSAAAALRVQAATSAAAKSAERTKVRRSSVWWAKVRPPSQYAGTVIGATPRRCSEYASVSGAGWKMGASKSVHGAVGSRRATQPTIHMVRWTSGCTHPGTPWDRPAGS
jgi:hypothetical protein